MKFAFERVEVWGGKTVKCKCGKKVKRAKTFCQTINPYNTINGAMKSRFQITEELIAQRDKWYKIPELCPKCRPKEDK